MTRTTQTGILGIDGTRLVLDGRPFPLTGLSFFNAIYNPSFNQTADERLRWLRTFRENGVNTLRIWCQWDFSPPRVFADVGPEQSLYTESGELRERHVQTLIDIILAADSVGMVLEVTLFSHEKQPNLPPEVLERGARLVTERLIPYRNLIVQLWNEDSTAWARLFQAVKATDPQRLVSSSPGVSNVLGDDEQNEALDILAPHTIRRSPGVPFWDLAPQQIAALLERFQKPVLDDEPARNGPVQFGGIEGGTRPEWHVEAIKQVRQVGGYPIYHHDLFQYGYDAPTTPPSGIPDPDFSPFHRQVFDYLRDTRA